VARKEGINRTARELHVAWDDLKRRMPATGAVSQQPAFVELVTPRIQSVPECSLFRNVGFVGFLGSQGWKKMREIHPYGRKEIVAIRRVHSLGMIENLNG